MRALLFVFLFMLNLSCSNDRKDLFLTYAKLNCSLKGKVARRDSISQSLSGTNALLACAKREANQKAGNYEYEIIELDNKIYQVKSEYEEKYNQLSKKHEAKHGHMMTPEYDQNVNKLEEWKADRLKPLEEEITRFNEEKEKNDDLKNLQKKIDSLEGLSTNQHERLQGCEKEVNNIKRQIQAMSAEMDEKLKQSSDKTKFMEHRKKVELNPCK